MFILVSFWFALLASFAELVFKVLMVDIPENYRPTLHLDYTPIPTYRQAKTLPQSQFAPI